MATDKKQEKSSKLIGTYFRNGLKSNLDLTTLADTKAGILISVNGFILTVVMTASGFVIQNGMMNIVFASIILTALISIIFAVFAIKPRSKDKLVKRIEGVEDYNSLLFYEDMANMHPKDFLEQTGITTKCSELSEKHLTTHLHILGIEIKKKYFWLKQAYTFFSIGLVVSVSLAVYGLVFIEQTPFNKISTGNISYKKGQFKNIFEPSGVVQLPNGKVLIVEDESKANISIASIDSNGYLTELEKLNMSKETKRIFKREIDDLEALSNDGNTIYAITSHSTTKANQNIKSRNKMISFEYKDGKLENLLTYSSLKEEIFKSFPDLFTLTSFDNKSFNIEGLAFDKSKGSLLVGLRSPLMKKEAILIEINNPDGLFKNHESPKFSKPIFLNLNDLGIRDIAYDEVLNGFWVIAGSSLDRDSRGFELWFLNNEKNTLKKVNNIPKIGFAEGITVIKRDNKKSKLLIVEDNGAKPNKSANYITLNKDIL